MTKKKTKSRKIPNKEKNIKHFLELMKEYLESVSAKETYEFTTTDQIVISFIKTIVKSEFNRRTLSGKKATNYDKFKTVKALVKYKGKKLVAKDSSLTVQKLCDKHDMSYKTFNRLYRIDRLKIVNKNANIVPLTSLNKLCSSNKLVQHKLLTIDEIHNLNKIIEVVTSIKNKDVINRKTLNKVRKNKREGKT